MTAGGAGDLLFEGDVTTEGGPGPAPATVRLTVTGGPSASVVLTGGNGETLLQAAPAQVRLKRRRLKGGLELHAGSVTVVIHLVRGTPVRFRSGSPIEVLVRKGRLEEALEEALRVAGAGAHPPGGPAPAAPGRDPFEAVWEALAGGDLDTAVAHIGALPPPHDWRSDVNHQRLRRLPHRAQLVRSARRLGHDDVRGWHALLTGGVLLSTSGIEEMNGRWAWYSEDHGACHDTLRRLVEVLQTLGRPVGVVYAFEDERGGEALASALGGLLGVGVQWWEPGRGPGLAVCYRLADLDHDTLAGLAIREGGQMLYEHCTDWVEPTPFTADLSGYLVQAVSPPWDQKMAVDFETREMRTTPPDPSPPEQLAARILDAPPRAAGAGDDDRRDLLALAAVLRATFLAEVDAHGAWRNGMLPGPVDSAAFDLG